MLKFLKKQTVTLDNKWTLFLDRDGVINDNSSVYYVRKWEEFVFRDDFLEAIPFFSKIFWKIIIVTNQQGIGKGEMKTADLEDIHSKMLLEIKRKNGRIDDIFFCPHREEDNCLCRKPKIGMALKAKEKYPEISFSKAVMIGDSPGDMLFAREAGMKTLFLGNRNCKIEVDGKYRNFHQIVDEFKKGI